MKEISITKGPTQETGKQWQIVFKTIDGLDYCREQQPAFCTYEEVADWAENECLHHGLGGAVIERW
jgi:hypothetical protein